MCVYVCYMHIDISFIYIYIYMERDRDRERERERERDVLHVYKIYIERRHMYSKVKNFI